MHENGGHKKHEERVPVQVVTLDSNELYNAITQYMHNRYGNGQVVNIEWVLTPEQGHSVPPMEDIAARVSVELKEIGS